MSYPNLFPGVDVSNLEDSGEEMGYGSYRIPPKKENFSTVH